MSKRRTFTDSFKLGDTVAVKRYRHGWFDGAISGKIILIESYICRVKVRDGGMDYKSMVGMTLEIDKPRDIFKV